MVIHDDCSAFSLMALTMMMLFISVSMMLTTTMMLDDDECPPLFDDDDDADDDYDVNVDAVNEYADFRRLFPILMMARL